MPDVKDPEYHFVPKPADPMPPISEHEFNRKFYNCYRGSKRHRHFLGITCRKTCRPANDALDRIPKRDRQVIIEGDKREIFWGLLAREAVSFRRVVVYHVIFLSAPFVFWVLWLLKWGHSGDWQNASVPFLAALGLLSLFWFPLMHK
jgi:hypothetical protein